MLKHFMVLATPVPRLGLLLRDLQNHPTSVNPEILLRQAQTEKLLLSCHRLSQELTFNLNLSRWASGNVKRSVSQVVTPALALIFTQLGCQHLSSHISLADSFGFLFSPFLHHTPFTALCSPSSAPTPEKLCLGAGALFHWLERASTGQRAFRTEATRPSDSQHTHSPPRRHCPDSSQAVTPSSVWSCSFQSDLACHSDYAFWLIFYEA